MYRYREILSCGVATSVNLHSQYKSPNQRTNWKLLCILSVFLFFFYHRKYIILMSVDDFTTKKSIADIFFLYKIHKDIIVSRDEIIFGRIPFVTSITQTNNSKGKKRRCELEKTFKTIIEKRSSTVTLYEETDFGGS